MRTQCVEQGSRGTRERHGQAAGATSTVRARLSLGYPGFGQQISENIPVTKVVTHRASLSKLLLEA
eukprot:9360648-Pyramimonas_sp.AAC.1